MSSDSELDEFFDAEDATPQTSFLAAVKEDDNGPENLDNLERKLQEQKRQLEEKRQREDQELEQKLQELIRKKREDQEKKMEQERKSKDLSSRRRKLEQLRNKMGTSEDADDDLEDSGDELDEDDGDLNIEEDEGLFQMEVKKIDSQRNETVLENNENTDKYSEYSVNINSSHPEKEKLDKEISDVINENFSQNNSSQIEVFRSGNCDIDHEIIRRDYLPVEDENEPDIIKSTRTPPNTLQSNQTPIMAETRSSPPPSDFVEPVAPPRRKKKRETDSTSSLTSVGERSSTSSLPDPMSPGLPSEILTPSSEVDNLTKALEHSLDLRSIIGGKKHIKAEDAEVDAVNSDQDSPRQTLETPPGSGNSSQSSKATSLDRKSEAKGATGDPKKSSSLGRPRSNSGRLLTDEEILESIVVKNLDTGETVALKDAEKELPKGVDPLALHILRRTKEFSSEKSHDMADIDEDARSEGSRGAEGEEHGVRKKATKFKKLLGKKVGKTYSKVKSVADHVLHGDDSVPEEEISDDCRRFKFKANHNHKGPYDFGQMQLIQDLGGEHTGAIWVMKFSPCGRLLATGGQDSVLRIWVLKSAYNYFDDMRQKYAEVKVSPAPSQESLNSAASSETSAMEFISPLDAEEEELKIGPFFQKPFCKYRGHSADLLDVSWSKNYFILSSSMDKTVRLWHISRRECLCTFQHIDFVTAIVFHPRDDRYFLSGSLDGKLRLWNIPDKKVTLWNEVQGSSNLITTANFCHNGKFAVVGTYDGKCIFFSTEQLKYYTQIHVRSTRGKNARGRKITGIEPLPGEDKVLVTSNDSRVRLYDLRDLTLTCKYKGPTNTSSQIKASFSPRGKYIICGSEDHFLYLWRTQHEFYKFSSARRDRNDYWEAIKFHNAAVTTALFAPHPSHFRRPEEIAMAKDTVAGENKFEIFVSADYGGSIRVIKNETKS